MALKYCRVNTNASWEAHRYAGQESSEGCREIIREKEITVIESSKMCGISQGTLTCKLAHQHSGYDG